jgi:hypothetical protein
MPRPIAWASAAALYLFAAGVRVMFSLAMPLLAALMRHSPRLAWLGLLLLWLSPVAIVAALHESVGRFIGASASAPRAARLATSCWAGFVAWATIIIVTLTMAFVVLVIDPPPVVDPDSVWNLAAAVTAGATRSSIWIVLAAYVYEVERRARQTD